MSLIAGNSVVSSRVVGCYGRESVDVSISFSVLRSVRGRRQNRCSLIESGVGQCTGSKLRITLGAMVAGTGIREVRRVVSRVMGTLPGIGGMSFGSLVSSDCFSSMRDQGECCQRFISGFFRTRSITGRRKVCLASPCRGTIVYLTSECYPKGFIIATRKAVSVYRYISSDRSALCSGFVFKAVGDSKAITVGERGLGRVLTCGRRGCREYGSYPTG